MNAAIQTNVRRGRLLEYVTIGWNVAEAFVAVGAGWIAGSSALLGFGFDSAVECLSGLVLLWRLKEGTAGTQRERAAQRLVGASLFVLAVYVAFDSVTALWKHEIPQNSVVGIGLALASVLVMPLLARAKRRVAVSLESRALAADSRQTDLCAYLSLILLVGLLLHAAFGWWWADPFAAIVMLPIILKEGIEAWRGTTVCTCH